MIGQIIDITSLELQIERKVERYQQKYKLTDSDLAWIFLRIGTNYYFRDICSRGSDGNGHSDNGEHI